MQAVTTLSQTMLSQQVLQAKQVGRPAEVASWGTPQPALATPSGIQYPLCMRNVCRIQGAAATLGGATGHSD